MFRSRTRTYDWLDDRLFTWPTGDPFTVRDCLRSIEVKGITGSGKSSGSGKFIAEKILKHPKSTFFIVGQKPEDKAFFQEMFARARKPLIVMEEGSKWKCNFLEDELGAGADTLNITELLTTLGESLQAGSGSGGENARFWRMLEQRIIYNAVGAVKLATGKLDATTLRDFISNAAYNDIQLQDEKWRKRLHYCVMKKAESAEKSSIDAHDYASYVDFWNNEFVHLDDKPRSSGLAGVMNTFHVFNTGLVWDTCSTVTTVSPRALDKGYSILVHYPFAEYGPTGRFIAGGMRYKVQKHILRKQAKPGDFFNVMMLDEFQESVTEFDGRYLAQCRSHYGCIFSLTQTVHSEYSSMGGGQASHHKVEALTSNFGHHIFHTVDSGTAKNASEMLGQRIEFIPNPGPAPQGPALDVITGKTPLSMGMSGSYQPVLQTSAFMHGLRQGGPANDFKVDGIVIRSGEPFSNGENWQKVAFDQRS